MPPEVSPRPEWTTAVVWIVGLSVTALIVVVTFAGLLASYGGYDYKCIVEGPYRESPPFALLSEAVKVRGYLSFWPLGRACDWERGDGLGFVTAMPDWTWTFAALVCAGVAITGAFLLPREDRRRRANAA